METDAPEDSGPGLSSSKFLPGFPALPVYHLRESGLRKLAVFVF